MSIDSLTVAQECRDGLLCSAKPITSVGDVEGVAAGLRPGSVLLTEQSAMTSGMRRESRGTTGVALRTRCSMPACDAVYKP